MNSKEFLNAVKLVVKEKGIDEDVIYEAMELALSSAYRKNFNSRENVRVQIDRKKGDIKVFSFLNVVEFDEEEGIDNRVIFIDNINHDISVVSDGESFVWTQVGYDCRPLEKKDV